MNEKTVGKKKTGSRALKTTGTIVGMAAVPCLSAGVHGAIQSGTNFGGTPNPINLGAFASLNFQTVGTAANVVSFVKNNFKWYTGGGSFAIAQPYGGPSFRALRTFASGQSIYQAFQTFAKGTSVYASQLRNAANTAWVGTGTYFVGIKFGSGIGTRHGYIQFQYNQGASTLTPLKWAYEDNGGPIQAGAMGSTPVPEPTGLGLLALGAAGLAARRRNRNLAA